MGEIHYPKSYPCNVCGKFHICPSGVTVYVCCASCGFKLGESPPHRKNVHHIGQTKRKKQIINLEMKRKHFGNCIAVVGPTRAFSLTIIAGQGVNFFIGFYPKGSCPCSVVNMDLATSCHHILYGCKVKPAQGNI